MATGSGVARRLKQAFLLGALGVSFLPLCAMLFNVRARTELRPENRRLADMPALRLKNFADASYFADFEKYFNDHFGLREWIIQKKHEFDWAAYRRVRPDLVCGADRFIEYKFIIERYVPELFKNFPREYMLAVFRQLHEELKKMGITLVFVSFPNKPLTYPDKIPSYWPIETDPGKLPWYQVLEELRQQGIPVLALAPEFRELRQREEVFTPVEENHCTPQALFHAMRRLLGTLGEQSGVTVDLPEAFPSVVQADIVGGQGYRSANRLRVNYGQEAPWTAVEPPKAGGGNRFFYTNTAGVLPSTTIYTDSFIQTLAGEFGPAFLPYFKELVLDYSTFSPESVTPRTKFVVAAFSDQSVEAHVHFYKRMLDRVRERRLWAAGTH